MTTTQNSVCIPLKAADGHRFELYVRHADQADAPVLLLFPALGVRAGYYDLLAEVLATAGFHVAWFDHRGQGKSSVKPGRGLDYGYETLLEKDYPVLVAAVKERFADQPLYFVGHSLGAQLSAVYAAKKRLKISGLIQIAAGTPYYKNWKGRQRIRLLIASVLFPVVSRVYGYFPGQLLKFAGRQAKTLMLDWSFTVRTGEYHPKGTRQSYERVMLRTECPILSITLPDDFFAPAAAAEHLYLKYGPASAVVHICLTADMLPHEKINHFNWAKEPELLLPYIKKWVDNQNKPQLANS